MDVDQAPATGTPGIPDRIDAIAARTPRAIALEMREAMLDYGTLLARADALAARLRAAGIGRDGIVAICLPRSPAQIVAQLAAWRAGAAYLPLDPAWPEARLSALLADAGCGALVAEPSLGARIAGDIAIVAPDGPAGAGVAVPEPIAADSPAYVIYTSGSTGAPKAVEVTHANLAALVDWHVDAFGVGAGMRTSHLAGLGFDAAAWEIWPTLAAGGTLVLAEEAVRRDPAALRDWLLAEHIAIAFAPTALAEPLMALRWPADCPLRVLLTGADRLTMRPPADLPFALVNNYGPTECTVVATSGIVAPAGEGLPTIGRPIAGTDIHLLDDSGAPVGTGETGEIWIGGASVARGYRGDAALTAARFVAHPAHGRLYRTGDLGVRLENGEIGFRGRVDEQVKVRGQRVEPVEVTAALNRLSGIAASAVVVRDGELLAYVVPARGARPIASALRAGLAAKLPDYMVPTRFAVLDALPLTPNGKIDRQALADPALVALPETSVARPASTPTEKRLLAIIATVIGHSDIGIDDDFFLLGGHSLLGTQVVMQAREAFGVELTLFDLFEGRKVSSLAEIVERLVIAKLETLSDEDVRRMAAG